MHQTLTVINVVEDFFADNTGATDTDTQINNALAAVPVGVSSNEAEGALVYFPRGTYKISKPLKRRVSFTRCVGEGKDATVISLDFTNWQPSISAADPAGAFIFDLASSMVTDCAVTDLRIDGNARNLTVTDGTTSQNYSGILCSARDEIARVSLYDIWGFGLWIFGPKAAYARVLDCEADLGSNPNATTRKGGNDCIGGGPVRAKIVRFYWFPTLTKNTALDMANGGGGNECSIDLEDCSNESGQDVVLEGCSYSRIVRCRFALPANSSGFANTLLIQSDAGYTNPNRTAITNPLHMLVADCVFEGATCIVHYDGGATKPATDARKTILGGRVAIMRNSFEGSPHSAIEWANDNVSTSLGGSTIAGNRISDPNQNGDTEPFVVQGAFVPLGTEYSSGIAVLASYGMTISDNTIDDTTDKMLYSMQLVRQDKAEPAATGRLLVTGNLCGDGPGQGSGTLGTFYIDNGSVTGTNPFPILSKNTNQEIGYDDNASEAVTNGQAWPPDKGYPYDAFVVVNGSDVTSILIGTEATGLTSGTFYLPVGQTITISWVSATRPSISVFRC